MRVADRDERFLEHELGVCESLLVDAVDKCNVSGETVSITGKTQWAREDVRGVAPIPGFEGTRFLEPGCTSVGPFENPVPDSIGPPGSVWILEGIETATGLDSGETHTLTWRTLPVTVTEN